MKRTPKVVVDARADVRRQKPTTREQAVARIAEAYPAIPKTVARQYWRKSDQFLGMMNRRYESGTAGCVPFDVVAEAPDAIGWRRDNASNTGVSRYDGWK